MKIKNKKVLSVKMSVQRRKINMKEATKLQEVEIVEQYKMIRPMKRSGPRRNITNDDLQPDEYDFADLGQGSRPRKNKISIVSSHPPSNHRHQPNPQYKRFKQRNTMK